MQTEKLTKLQKSLEDYFGQLAHGNPHGGVATVKRQFVMRLFDTVINSPHADSELKERAFFLLASYNFAESYEELNSETDGKP